MKRLPDPRRPGPIFPGAPETAFGTTRMKAALEGQYTTKIGGGGWSILTALNFRSLRYL